MAERPCRVGVIRRPVLSNLGWNCGHGEPSTCAVGLGKYSIGQGKWTCVIPILHKQFVMQGVRMDWRRNSFAELGIGRLLVLGLLMSFGLHAPAQAAEFTRDLTLAVGVLAHDRGPISDNNEAGVDLNLEAQFAPLDILGSPRPHLGVTANFVGDTSAAYAGLGFRFYETPQWFVDGLLSVALHDGPLHKDPTACQLNSDCGFGIRVLPRFGLEIGYRVSRSASVSLFFDHMSHKWVVAGENEGLDHIGLRYLWPY